MYQSCLRCNRSLGANAEIAHLPVGRRIAFDTQRGRLWVICTRCGQWNLTPLEERWEALEECEDLADKAEAQTSGTTAALVQTTSGLELLRVGGMNDADIANWRYGRRINARNRGHLWWLMPLEGFAVSMGNHDVARHSPARRQRIGHDDPRHHHLQSVAQAAAVVDALR